jgi:hypothetical protein
VVLEEVDGRLDRRSGTQSTTTSTGEVPCDRATSSSSNRKFHHNAGCGSWSLGGQHRARRAAGPRPQLGGREAIVGHGARSPARCTDTRGPVHLGDVTEESDDYVVRVDVEGARRMTEQTARTYTRLAYLCAGLAGALVAIALALATDAITDRLDTGSKVFLVVLAGVTAFNAGLLGGSYQRTVARLRRAPGAGDRALCLTAAGIRTGTDRAPDAIFVPWPLVTGFRVATWRQGRRRIPLLVMQLAPGAATAPDVEGLDLPDVRRMLRPPPRGLGGIALASSLLEPLSALDEALRERTDGRVGIGPSEVAASA